MGVCYNKLWKLLIDRKMKKKELLELSGISKSAEKAGGVLRSVPHGADPLRSRRTLS